MPLPAQDGDNIDIDDQVLFKKKPFHAHFNISN